MSDLTAEEQGNVRTALRFLRTRIGGWKAVAKALHVSQSGLENVVSGRRSVSPTVAFRVARLTGVSVEDVLDGTYPAAGTCPYCGHCPEQPTGMAS